MLHPRFLRSSAFVTPLVRQTFPTGNGFGGSSLNTIRFQISGFKTINNSEHSAVKIPTHIQPASLLIEVGKIFILTLWLWCAIAFDSCWSGMNSRASYSTQDV
ncbi:hypothetical protein [Chamaesiphon sp. OTE_20_metabat_361]|uniref:hypothetical protein n=1 Tax=Chamaesiphon sp. OTE_20_metabat_361 TaxID=2964689 RepID=UPI00286B0E39|nr:hypothetical protein [Chamaesiphon sp. OTE_20_metabat_361]